jgi:uncharacterized protein YbbK (DUF523 family)
MDDGADLEPAILVSACLLGVPCNHEGRPNRSSAVAALVSTGRRLVPVCPEVAGGLPTPRMPVELRADGRAVTADGDDVTEFYRRGAAVAVALAGAVGAREAVLKARSPSCGCHEVYDGTFSRRRVPGEGVTARALREAGLTVRSEEDVAASVAESARVDTHPGA